MRYNTLSKVFNELKQDYGNSTDWLNLKNEGADFTGINNIYSILSSSSKKYIYFGSGTYLLDTNYTCPEESVLLFDIGAKLKIGAGVTFTANNTQINANLDQQIFDLSESGSALSGNWICDATAEWFGAVGDNNNDDYNAFLNAVKYFKNVVILENTYKIGSPIDILSSYSVLNINGNDRTLSKINFYGTSGIIVNKQGINLNNFFIKGDSTASTYGINVYKPFTCNKLNIYTFDIGINLANSVHIVTSSINNNTIGYCVSQGIKLIATATAQKNGIDINNNYIVKCGSDADNLTSDATLTYGDGIYLQGGYSISIRNNVFEYNTRCGLRIVGGTDIFAEGISSIGNYFERNKYANQYVDFTENLEIQQLTIIGSFYTDAGYSPVSNALSNRELYCYPSNFAVNSRIEYFKDSQIEKYGFANRNILLRRNNFINAFPTNDLQYLSSRYNNNLVEYDSSNCFMITHDVPGNTLYDELIFVDDSFDYLLTYEVCKVNTDAEPPLLVYLYDYDTSTLKVSSTKSLSGSSFTWYKVHKKISASDITGVNKLRMYINIEGTKSTNCEVYIKNIKVVINPFIPSLENTLTWNPASLSDGEGETSSNITVTGASLGDYVLVSAPYDLQGITCNAYVSASNTVNIRIQNETGGAIDLAEGTWKVKIIK